MKPTELRQRVERDSRSDRRVEDLAAILWKWSGAGEIDPFDRHVGFA